MVVPTNGKDYSDADLRALEDRQIQQAGHVDASGIAHGSVQINGGAYQTATADISPSGGDTLSSLAASTITIIATVHGGRVYAFPGLVNRSPGVGQNNPRYDVEQQLLRASFATVTLV